MDNAIHVAIATDDNYVDFALIVVNSIMRFHSTSGGGYCRSLCMC